MNEELELYKLIMFPDEDDSEILYVNDFGWLSEEEFCVWISYTWLEEFMDGLKRIFGECIFDEGGVDGHMQPDGVCIDLCAAIWAYVDIESVFPKEKYKY